MAPSTVGHYAIESREIVSQIPAEVFTSIMMSFIAWLQEMEQNMKIGLHPGHPFQDMKQKSDSDTKSAKW